jgi:hypothetical protein
MASWKCASKIAQFVPLELSYGMSADSASARADSDSVCETGADMINDGKGVGKRGGGVAVEDSDGDVDADADADADDKIEALLGTLGMEESAEIGDGECEWAGVAEDDGIVRDLVFWAGPITCS